MNRELVIAPPDFNISYIGFNTSMPPFDDVKFRLALNHAIDKELIAKEVLSDLVVPAYGILPPGFPAYNPGIQGLRFDPTLAKQLLAESRYAQPDARPPIVISVPGTGGNIGLDLEVILEMWRQVLDVEVEIQQQEWATYLRDLNRSRFQAFAGIGWEADYPDPQDFLDILFHSESSINHGDYSNPAVDSILEEARVEQDVIRRTALLPSGRGADHPRCRMGAPVVPGRTLCPYKALRQGLPANPHDHPKATPGLFRVAVIWLS